MPELSNMRLVDLLTAASNINPENELLQEIYKRHGKYTPEALVQELREDASNTIGRLLTGSVDYDEAVRRVAKKINIDDADLTDDEIQNEILIIRKCLQDYIKNHPEAEEKLKDVTNELAGESQDIIALIQGGTASSFLMKIQSAGPKVVSRILTAVMVRFIGHQAATSVGRFAAMGVPFLNLIMAAWFIYGISGPAYRKIVPSILNIALLRLQIMSSFQDKNQE